MLFVVRDGSIGIGPLTPPSYTASGSRGDVALASSSLSVLDPDAEVPNSQQNDFYKDVADIDEDDDDDDDADIPRSNRFQLHPARVTDILAEASRSRNASPSNSVLRGLKPGKPHKAGRQVSVRIPGDPRDDGELGWEGWRRVLSLDVGCVMRRRAEEGYGLSNVSGRRSRQLMSVASQCRYCNALPRLRPTVWCLGIH